MNNQIQKRKRKYFGFIACLSIIVLFSGQTTPKRFRFDEWIKISQSLNKFEQKMYESGYDILDKVVLDTGYSYKAENNVFGSGTGIPTTDSSLKKNSKYTYVPGLISFTPTISTRVSFAENYDKVNKVANSFLYFVSIKYIINPEKNIFKYNTDLKITTFSDDYYKQLTKEIQIKAKYKATRKLLDYLYVDYTYYHPILKINCDITCMPSSNKEGGSISFAWYKLKND